MAKKMLIDATQPEEIRVAVVSGNLLEELDSETAARKQLKGNIYLAKVVRVEPSLQAAFVEYGGNRHGFLAFTEIHPDYYRIPVADREALIAEEEAFAKAQERVDALAEEEDEDLEGGEISPGTNEGESSGPALDEERAELANPDVARRDEDLRDADEEQALDTLGGNEIDEAARRRRPITRKYKIQEVTKRRQVMLVQVTKEERGTKGAALTTRLSLAGRYCVLMPNTGRGGGISRKIASPSDRKRLRAIIESLNIPDGMSMIVRTAGDKRTKAEIRRDYEYLLRLWSDIRELTLKSKAPALIYEEANLIKRSIRDLYTRDMDEVLIEGEEGYHTAKAFMRTLMPSHAKYVQPYKDPTIPLFHRYQIESQIDAIHNPVVRLRSGGYIVINQAEALVAVDVNSGRATRERNIEETALKTNLEAADEVARQLRLRDLAGLIVIDFIDMDIPKNQRAVERRFKEAMKSDRARIQIGRISPFGLLEMSRQRLRPSLVEISTERCPKCAGMGVVRSTESTALHVLRTIEDEGIRKRSAEVAVFVPTDVALYILNQKRQTLNDIEARHGFRVTVNRDETLTAPEFRIETIKGKEPGARPVAAHEAPEIAAERETVEMAVEEMAVEEEKEALPEKKAARKRRRRGKRGGRRRSQKTARAAAEGLETPPAEVAAQGASEASVDPGTSQPADAAAGEETKPAKRARRRRKAVKAEETTEAAASGTDAPSGKETTAGGKPKTARASRGRRRAAKRPAKGRGGAQEEEPTAPSHEPAVEESPVAAEMPAEAAVPAAVAESTAETETSPKRRGWWQRPSE